MKILQILALILVGFVFEAEAQLCGKYRTTLKVVSDAGNPVENAEIKIIPVGQESFVFGGGFAREKENPFRYTITFNEGNVVRGEYNVVVLARGFSAAERKMSFPHCASSVYEVVLKPKGAGFVSTINDLIRLRGETYGNKTRLAAVELTATDEAGKTFKTKADGDGFYTLELPYGNYTFVYRKIGYKTLKVINVEIRERKNIYLYSAELELRGANKDDNIVTKDFKDLYKSKDVY